jgi:hypothetical protein
MVTKWDLLHIQKPKLPQSVSIISTTLDGFLRVSRENVA